MGTRGKVERLVAQVRRVLDTGCHGGGYGCEEQVELRWVK